jgi:hypothetical protein
MIAEKELSEYLAEIRETVCSRCVERPPNGPPCAPLGKDCGVELHLPQLIESIHAVQSPMVAPYLEHNRHEICEKCVFLHSSICPCPMDYLSALVVEAVENVEKRREDRTREQEFLANRFAQRPADIGAIRQAFEDARGTWTGCDWHTQFGDSGLDLNGLTPEDAETMASQTAGTEVAADWRAAVSWLAQVQHHAEQAEAEAALALHAAELGDWHKAVRRAERAFLLEFATGRALRSPFSPTWQPLHRVIRDAFLTRDRDPFATNDEVQAQD